MSKFTGDLLWQPPQGATAVFVLGQNGPLWNLTGYVRVTGEADPRVFCSFMSHEPRVLGQMAAALTGWFVLNVPVDSALPPAAPVETLTKLAALGLPDAAEAPPLRVLLGQVAAMLDRGTSEAVGHIIQGKPVTAELAAELPPGILVGPDKQGLYATACGARYGADKDTAKGWWVTGKCLLATGAEGAPKCDITGAACWRTRFADIAPPEAVATPEPAKVPEPEPEPAAPKKKGGHLKAVAAEPPTPAKPPASPKAPAKSKKAPTKKKVPTEA